MSSNRTINAGYFFKQLVRQPNRSGLLIGMIAWAIVIGVPGIALATADDRLSSVSMVVLLVSPERYVGKRVNVTGYLTVYSLFMTEEAAFRVDTASAIAFQRSDEEVAPLNTCGNNHARITARFVRDADFEVYSLAEIESIRVYDIVDGSARSCWRREDSKPVGNRGIAES